MQCYFDIPHMCYNNTFCVANLAHLFQFRVCLIVQFICMHAILRITIIKLWPGVVCTQVVSTKYIVIVYSELAYICIHYIYLFTH